MKKFILIILILLWSPALGNEVIILNCSSKAGLGLDLLNNLYSYKEQGIKEDFKVIPNNKEIIYESGKFKRIYKIVDKRRNPNGGVTIVSYYINKNYYGGYMLTLSLNDESKEYLYSSAMMGAGEILEGPVGSRGSCKKL
tara:strand:+ start:61 stop:480 length:420 start_codon:yes stop_codon:yes gene_type:complete